jgi:hypothetical protein
MTKRKWALITAIFTVAYGAFLLFQAYWSGWTIVQGGTGLSIAKIVGGLALLCWGAVFFKLKG